jgi:thiosulfate dehydrogenase [quinone] large subunit
MVDIAKPHSSAATATDTPRTGPAHSAADPARVNGNGQLAPTVAATDPRVAAATRYLLAGIRIGLGFIFLWAFLDKVFGLGFYTTTARAWINGGNPTEGFLSSSKGPFSGFFQAIAGTGIANVLFMGGLLAIGTALILGIGMRLAAAGGALLMVMMWAAVLPPATNPIIDDHLIYAAILIVLALLAAGNTLGMGRAWAAIPLVQRNPWLK